MGLTHETYYEKYKIYKANPCDLDCGYRPLKALGKTLAWSYQAFNTGCDCCSATRVWLAVLTAFTLGYALK